MGSLLLETFTLFMVLLSSLILVKAVLGRNRTQTKGYLPPSPWSLPVIGHMHHLSPIPHQAFHKLSKRYGPLIHIFIGSNPCIIVSAPEIAKEILKTNETSFLNRPKMTNPDYLTYGSSDFTFAPYGPYWKFIKKLCMTQLLGGPTLNYMVPIRREELRRSLNSIHAKGEENAVINVWEALVRLTNNTISMMALSKRCSEEEDEADEVRTLVKEMVELAGKFNVSDSIWFCKGFDPQGFGPRLKDVRRRYDEMMERIIKEHQDVSKESEGGDNVKDLLDMLLEIHEDQSSQVKLSMENIKAFLLNIFGAGTDTTSITVEWALAELINHPDVMKNMRQEMDSAVGQERVVAEADIPNLPYVQAVVKETLRLHPTGPLIVRESTEDCTINGFHIPAKTRVFVNVWDLGRDPNHWENPLEFWPDRFINGGESSRLDVRGQNFQFLPFGSGRRTCPGASLAMLVVQTTLAAMVQCFEWKVVNGGVDMEEGPGMALPRAHPLMCVPVARFNIFPLK